MLKSPENYNQMLATLNVATGACTLAYSIVLVYLGIIPRIAPDNALIPPIKNYHELIAWFLSFGVLPFVFGMLAFAVSRIFEVHNIMAKLLGIRYVWDRFFIAEPLRVRAKAPVVLSREAVKQIMDNLYYPSVRQIDQHYVQLFWRYALPFWILFEHVLVVLLSLFLLFLVQDVPLKGLVWYRVGAGSLCGFQFLAVTAPKSTDQANQIPLERVTAFFEELRSRLAST